LHRELEAPLGGWVSGLRRHLEMQLYGPRRLTARVLLR
jgi:hypothetical protein